MTSTKSVLRERSNAHMPTEGWSGRLQRLVLNWFDMNGRDFPWRRTSNPFHLLIAEALLRQTQAERVVGPYLELVSRFPDPEPLARADVEELRRWFRPLGLVRRADRLVRTAQVLVREYDGRVPNDLDVLLGLPGMGTYSARAILCLGFESPVPMVDEGSGRVLRRIMGLAEKGPAYSDRELLLRAEQILPESHTQRFNLGLIDIAAAFCRPHAPACPQCPLVQVCQYGKTRMSQNEGEIET